MKRKIMEALEYMEQIYIDEAVEYGKKTWNYKPLVKWGAVAACLVLAVSLVLGMLGGQPTTPQNKEIVLPPVREANQTANKVIYAESLTLEECLAEADAVAWVRVGSWLGEDLNNHPIGKTYFEAEVVECYKGALPDSFVLKQTGSSKWTFKDEPMFTYGNELLLFLNYSYADIAIGNCFSILRADTVIDVVQDGQGRAYASVRNKTMGLDLALVGKNYGFDYKLKPILASATEDEYQSGFISESKYIFALEEIRDHLKK